MNYEYLWKELEALVVDMRSKGKEVPNEVVEDLKSAKTLMTIQSVDPSSSVSADVEDYLRRTEAAVISNAEYYLGKEYAEQWLSKIQDAKARGLREYPKKQVGFVSGIPKGDEWVRVKITDLVDIRTLDVIVHKLGLSKRVEAEDTVLLYGSPEKVKAFMKQLTEKVKRK